MFPISFPSYLISYNRSQQIQFPAQNLSSIKNLHYQLKQLTVQFTYLVCTFFFVASCASDVKFTCWHILYIMMRMFSQVYLLPIKGVTMNASLLRFGSQQVYNCYSPGGNKVRNRCEFSFIRFGSLTCTELNKIQMAVFPRLQCTTFLNRKNLNIFRTEDRPVSLMPGAMETINLGHYLQRKQSWSDTHFYAI